jgi:hypothetical protein
MAGAIDWGGQASTGRGACPSSARSSIPNGLSRTPLNLPDPFQYQLIQQRMWPQGGTKSKFDAGMAEASDTLINSLLQWGHGGEAVESEQLGR